MFTDKTIFISAYRNVSIRYILYSDIFKELKKSGFRIVIFLKDNDIDFYREQFKSDNVFFEPVLFAAAYNILRSHRVGKYFVLLRRYLPCGTNSHENKTAGMVDYYVRLNKFKSLVFALIAKMGKKWPNIRKAIVVLESYLFPGKIYDAYFEKYRPGILITSSTGYMIDPYFMRAAARFNCKVLSIIHSWDNPTTKDYRGANPDYVVAWNDIMKDELVYFQDIEEEKIYIGGIAHWDFYFNGSFRKKQKNEFLRFHGLSGDRKIIFYGTSSWVHFRRTFDIIEQLLEEIKKDRFNDPVQFLVRLHPGYLLKQRGKEGQVVDLYRERMENIKEKYGDLISFNLPMMNVLNDDVDMPVEDMYNLAEILHYSDLLLTEYSTLMIEGAIFDLPIVNVSLYNYRDTDKPVSILENFTHIKRVLKTGACKNAYTFDQLLEYVNYYLKDCSRDEDRRAALVEQEITANRGHAGANIARYISDCLSRN